MDQDDVRAPIAPQQMRLVDDMMDRPVHGSFRPLHYARAIAQGGASSSSNNNGNGPAANFRAMMTAAYHNGSEIPGPSGPSTFDRYRFMASDTCKNAHK